jgi:hypothetical protein
VQSEENPARAALVEVSGLLIVHTGDAQRIAAKLPDPDLDRV